MLGLPKRPRRGRVSKDKGFLGTEQISLKASSGVSTWLKSKHYEAGPGVVVHAFNPSIRDTGVVCLG